MKLKNYEFLIFIITVLLGYEYLCLNNQLPMESFIKYIGKNYLHQNKFNYSPVAGYPISYFLGWLGFSVILTTNFYIIRKRFHIWENIGKASGWLDFHIFCGILGPIFIIFHSNFKVNGLVSISFWSMIIASTSGILGRYFYIQTLKKREEMNKSSNAIRKNFEEKHSKNFSQEQIDNVFSETLSTAGANGTMTNPLFVWLHSIRGDFNLFFNPPGKSLSLGKDDVLQLKKYGIDKRRILFLEPFNRLLGYWHSFHLPFAVFMYIVAVIHIFTALLFGVKH